MITHILLDADGVIIKAHEYYSTVYARENNLDLKQIEPFFKDKFPACKIGQADLKIELNPYLKIWAPEETIEKYLTNWFRYDVNINEPVLNFARKLKSKNIKLYLATDQEKYRAEYIKNLPELNGIFDDMFFSCDLGTTKNKPEFFRNILSKLSIKPNHIAFWDDEQENVDSAHNAEINSFFYSSFESFQNQLDSLNIDSN